MTEEKHNIRLASVQMMNAGRCMAMAIGDNFDDPTTSRWFDPAIESFKKAARNTGFTLVPITKPAEDHAEAIARRVAEDSPVPITDEPEFDDRDDSAVINRR